MSTLRVWCVMAEYPKGNPYEHIIGCYDMSQQEAIKSAAELTNDERDSWYGAYLQPINGPRVPLIGGIAFTFTEE